MSHGTQSLGAESLCDPIHKQGDRSAIIVLGNRLRYDICWIGTLYPEDRFGASNALNFSGECPLKTCAGLK